MQINKTMFNVPRSFSAIADMQESMSKLQMQLATQKKASSLSELGRERVFDLNIRDRVGRLQSYQSNITTVNLRLDFLDNSISRLDEIEADSRSAVASGGVGADGINLITAKQLATSRLDEVLSILNGDINGRHMFAGSATDSNPVPSLSQLMEGTGTKDGFNTIAAQRKMADAGADGKGRLVTDIAALTSAIPGGATNSVTLTEDDAVTHPYRPQLTGITTDSAGSIAVSTAAGPPVEQTVLFTDAPTAPVAGETVTIDVTLPDGTVENRVLTAVAGAPANANEFQIGATPDDTATNFKTALDGVMVSDTMTLSEDAVHDFGLKLSAVTSNSAGISASAPTGVPQMTSLRVTANPEIGDSVDLRFTLPNGNEETITLKAVSGTPQSSDEFQVGNDPAETTANLEAALSKELKRVGGTTLQAASVYKASDDFFNGRGETVTRVGGPNYYTATTMVNATDADTVMWYAGEDASGSPRQAVNARVDENTKVGYGVQANESGIVSLVRSLAALSVEDYPENDENGAARFEAMSKEQLVRLSESNNRQDGSIEVIALELGVARTTVGAADDRHKAYNVQLETMLSDIESAPIDEIAMQLLQLQTRLEASYQTTGIVAGLSLVNYVR